MKTSQVGIDLIKEFEGFRDRAYQDIVGVWTIGFGSTRFKGQLVAPGMKCTTAEAEDQLRIDVSVFEESINDLVKVKLTQNQFDALISFTYNLGATNFRKSTLLKKINNGRFADAADEFLKWNRAGGKVVSGLVRRRDAERKLFIGEMINE